MKQFKLFAYAALMMASMFITSCSEEDTTQYSTAGTLSEINVDRTKIGTYQWFTVSGSYKSGSTLSSEKLYISIDGGLTSPITLSNNTSAVDFSVALHLTTPGKHYLTVSASCNGIFNDGTYQQNVEMTKEIDVVSSDIRCNFWNETREETLHNLACYSTLRESGEDLVINEEDLYGTIDYSSEAHMEASQVSSIYNMYADRTVTYKFDGNQTLNEIRYICTPQDQSATKYVTNLTQRVHHMQSEYNFVSYSSNASQINLTPEETTAVEACVANINAGQVNNLDPNGEIGNLIKNKGLTLQGLFRSKDGKTVGGISTFYSSNKFSILVVFQPASQQ